MSQAGCFGQFVINAADLVLIDSRCYSADEVSRVFSVPSALLVQVSERNSRLDSALLGLEVDSSRNQGEA